MYSFDEVVDRKGTWSMKWDDKPLESTFNNSEVLPLWVADMDFKVAPAITKAIQKVVDHGIFGYSVTNEPNKALANWMNHRHDWEIDTKWITNTPGVVFALNIAVQTFTKPGDSILIQRPVYYPFTDAIENNGRKVVSNSLVGDGIDYNVDFEDFEEKAKDPNTTMFFLCSPHNPLGKVFTADELKRMLDIAFENNLTVVADEIHGDLIMPGVEYNTVGNLGEEYANKVVTCLAPSKTFNLAGTQWSGIVIPDELKRHQFRRTIEQLGYNNLNPFSFAAVIAAYNESEDWLDEVIDYVYNNYLYLKETFESELEGVQVLDLEATYLAFVDFRGLGISDEELQNLITHKANVGLDAGNWFGKEAEGFMRFNLACSREVLEEAVRRIIKVLKEV
jgi:cystathionine beta-lyase